MITITFFTPIYKTKVIDFEKLPLAIKTYEEYVDASSILDGLYGKLLEFKKMNFNSSDEKNFCIKSLMMIEALQDALTEY